MKKLFPVMSIILCVVMLSMNAFAAGAVPDEDPYAVFKKAMDKASDIKYAEISGIQKTTTNYPDRDIPADTDVSAGSIRLIVSPDNKYSGESVWWDENSEIVQFDYVKNGYHYDSITRRRYDGADITIKDDMYSIAGTEPDSYKDDIKNLTVQKISGGYELRYKIAPYDGSDYNYNYTIALDKDYMIKSVKESHHRKDGYYDVKSVYKYEFVSVNKPFTIDFPYDLNSYTIAN